MMLTNTNDYFEVLENIKKQIKSAQYKAVLSVNREQIVLHWNIGQVLSANAKYGNGFIQNLAKDLKLDFPNAKGYSYRSLLYMRKFADFYSVFGNLPTVLADLSWSHNRLILDKIKDPHQAKWYAEQTVENGWGINSLEYYIETKSFERQIIAENASNYEKALDKPFSELAQETLKNPFVFDFIEKRKGIIEREIERELVANIANTILELGNGFSFVGNQYHIEVSGMDYYIDLLFYNLKLRCFVVIELKNSKFKPAYAGQLNFYLSAVDDMLKHHTDNPSIGILLCKERDKLTAEYALKDINKPIGVSEYRLSDFVPEELVDTLPSAEDIEKRIKLDYDIDEEDDDVE